MGIDELLKKVASRDPIKELKKRYIQYGQEIGGYKIGQVLDTGGFAEVRDAKHLESGDNVVLKYPKPEYFIIDEKAANARFENEARTLSELHHPNIVKGYHPFKWKGIQYIATECADLPLLSYFGYEINIQDVYKFLRQATSAINHSHQKGIIHCDIKLDNFRVNLDGTYKLMDFGGAGMIGEKVPFVSISKFYFPRKLILQDNPQITADPVIDIYGLGKTAARIMLSFIDLKETSIDDIMKKNNDEEILERMRQSMLPEYLISGVIGKCLDAPNLGFGADELEDRLSMLNVLYIAKRIKKVTVTKDIFTGRLLGQRAIYGRGL